MKALPPGEVEIALVADIDRAWPDRHAARGLSVILCAGPVFVHSGLEPLAEEDGELDLGFEPLARRPFPLVGRLIEDQV